MQIPVGCYVPDFSRIGVEMSVLEPFEFGGVIEVEKFSRARSRAKYSK